MKFKAISQLIALSAVLLIAPVSSFAKEQSGTHKGESRKATVHGSSKSSKAHNGHHRSNQKHYSTKKRHNGHKYHNSHKRHHHKSYRRHHNHGSFTTGLVLGATLHHTFGPHGRYYRGHAWCPSHYLYHTHGYVHTYHYDHHRTYYGPRKVESYIELDDGMCYKVTEYSNGDQKRKRIRDYHCDDLDEWDDWEE